MKLFEKKRLSGYQLKKAQQDEEIKRSLLKGDPGADGKSGDDGTNGLDGDPGKRGDNGKDFTYYDFTAEQIEALKGTPGKKGDDGKRGPKGLKGDDGKDGEDGEDGRGIERLQIINDNLWVFYDDGTKENLGPVRERGRSVSVIGRGTANTWQPTEKFTLDATDISNGFVLLSKTPLANSEFVYTNGLFEPDCYTLTGNKLDFTALGLVETETIEVKYQT